MPGIINIETNCATSSNSYNFYIGDNYTSMCYGTTLLLYYSGSYTTGTVLYFDSALTTPATDVGFNYVLGPDTIIRYYDYTTATVGADTGFNPCDYGCC
jgi:hypothetical protein